MGVSRGRGLAAGSSRPLRSLRRGGGQRRLRYPRFRGAGSIKFRRLLRRCYAPGTHDLAARPPPQYCQPPPQPSEPARSSNPPLWRVSRAVLGLEPPWRSRTHLPNSSHPRGSIVPKARNDSVEPPLRFGFATRTQRPLCLTLAGRVVGAVELAVQQLCIHLASSDSAARLPVCSRLLGARIAACELSPSSRQLQRCSARQSAATPCVASMA